MGFDPCSFGIQGGFTLQINLGCRRKMRLINAACVVTEVSNEQGAMLTESLLSVLKQLHRSSEMGSYFCCC